jgi:hypothetical protein
VKKKAVNIFFRAWRFYLEGFSDMSKWGRQVWIIILIKIFILFAILKIFFFPDFLKVNFKTDQERGIHVRQNLTDQNYNL